MVTINKAQTSMRVPKIIPCEALDSHCFRSLQALDYKQLPSVAFCTLRPALKKQKQSAQEHIPGAPREQQAHVTKAPRTPRNITQIPSAAWPQHLANKGKYKLSNRLCCVKNNRERVSRLITRVVHEALWIKKETLTKQRVASTVCLYRSILYDCTHQESCI